MNVVSDPVPWTEGQVVVDGVRLQLRRAGRPDNPPLVLAHGLSDSGRCWDRSAQLLIDHFDVVALDARNHGGSDSAATSAMILANDVVSAIAALELHRPVLMGHSIGAHTSALVAGQLPGQISKLVIEDPPWTPDRQHAPLAPARISQRRDEIVGWLKSFAGMSASEIAEHGRVEHPTWPATEYPAWVESNQQVRVEAADGLDTDSWATTVEAIACPTLLLYGESGLGGLVTAHIADAIADMNPCVSPRHIADAGHNIRRENFDEFIEVVIDFLTLPPADCAADRREEHANVTND